MVAIQYGDAQIFGMRNLAENNLTIHLAMAEMVDLRNDAIANKIVAQEKHKAFITDKIARRHDAVCEPQRRLLWNVSNFRVEVRTIAHCGANLVTCIANDNADVSDAGLDEVFDRVEEDGLVREGNELFRAGVGEGAHSRSFASAQD